MNEWVSLLQTFGLATMIILFMGVCIWKGGGWAGENVVKPIVERYIRLIDSLIVAVAKQGEAMDKQGIAMTAMITLFNEMVTILSQLRKNGSQSSSDGSGVRKV